MEDQKDKTLVPIVTTTRNVIESYIFATGKQKLSIYSERLLMQLVKIAQCQVNGLNFRNGSGIAQVSIGKLGDAHIEIDARELLSKEGDKNYTQAKESVLELMSKKIEHERPASRYGKPVLDDAGKQVYEYEAHNLLNDIWINKKPGIIEVNVNKVLWETLLDFSKGFRRYDLQVAMKFSSVCTLRMFKLISNQTMPLTYSIEDLKEQWGLTDKYKNTRDFIKYTIEKAKHELDLKSPWTFDFEMIYAKSSEKNRGRVGRKAITAVRFTPIHQVRYESTTNIASKIHPKDLLGKPIIDRLVKNLGFSIAEIKANQVLLNTAKKYFELEDFLIEITPKASRAGNPQGYVINAIKNHLREKHGLIIKKNEILQEKAIEHPDGNNTGESRKSAIPGAIPMKTGFATNKSGNTPYGPKNSQKSTIDNQGPGHIGNIMKNLFADLEE